MVDSNSAYFLEGAKAERARRKGDQSAYKHCTQWARGLSPDARADYEAGKRSEVVTRPVEYFR